MNYQMTAGEALQAFCRAWLVERDVEAAMAFIREDVDFVGTGIGESARGRDEMLSYLRQDMLEIPEPFTLLLTEINEQVIAEHVRNLSAEVTLKNSVYTWHVRGFFTMVMEGGRAGSSRASTLPSLPAASGGRSITRRRWLWRIPFGRDRSF